MHWFYLYITVFAAGYVLVMAIYLYGWRKARAFTLVQGYAPRLRLTVIVPARNEAANIRECLLSILGNDYPPALWEIFVVDDHSEDRTAAIVEETFGSVRVGMAPDMHLLRLSELISPAERANLIAFKKKGIELAIARSTGTLVVTTDADCVVQPGWLRRLAYAHEVSGAEVIAAPVLFHREKGLLQCFQSLDFIGMMGITAAGIGLRFQYMANGANFAYTRRIFDAVKGFEGIDGLASGDDMLLMQKAATRTDAPIAYLKDRDAATFTLPAPDFSAFWRQRIRWASKSAHYFEPWTATVLVVVFCFCWAILIASVLAVFSPASFALPFFFLLSAKIIPDYIFLGTVSRFFGYENRMRWFLPSFVLHTFYIAAVGLAVQFKKKYEWKGRAVR